MIAKSNTAIFEVFNQFCFVLLVFIKLKCFSFADTSHFKFMFSTSDFTHRVLNRFEIFCRNSMTAERNSAIKAVFNGWTWSYLPAGIKLSESFSEYMS